MSKKISPLFPLGLALILTAGYGCKAAPEKSVTAGTPTGKAPQTAPAPAAAPGSAASSEMAKLPGASGKPADKSAGPLLPPEKIPAVVCRVNGQEISKKELMDGAQLVELRAAQAGQKLDPTTDLYHRVLDELINITLLQQDAKAQGITAPEGQVKQMLDARKRQFPSEQVYQNALKQAGVTESKLNQQAREQLIVQKYVETKLAPQVNVPEAAARDFYEKHKADMQMPERLHLRHILVMVPPKASPADKEKARKKAEDALQRLQKGEDFAKVAAEVSDDPGSKTRGGDIGFISKGQTVPGFEAAAFALKKPNDLTPVVESQYGFHIIQLLERQPASAVPFDQVKDRIVALLKQQQIQKLFEDRAAQLRAKSKVEIYI